MSEKITAEKGPFELQQLNMEPSEETNSAKTEDSLLHTRSNSETTSISKGEKNKSCCCKKINSCCPYCGLVTGFFLASLAILMMIWTPYYVFMEQRLEMIPGLPAFDWWATPPDELYISVYIFNVTNSESFLNGSDSKMHVEEVGPIIYLEKLTHSNVIFNDNGTLSYTVNRSAIYLPDKNTIDINSPLVVPNYAVLGIVAYLHDASAMTKFGFNIVLRAINSPMFINTTIYNFLWNFTDPILSMARHFAPHIVASENFGMLHTLYSNFEDNATVYIGIKNGHQKFFLIDKFDGAEYLPGHGPSCHESVVNATEGALYPQYIQKNMSFKYWRKSLCRTIPLVYEKDVYMDDYNVWTYKFKFPKTGYDRKANLSEDCHAGNPPMPSGLSDVSKCYNGISMAASYPHLLYTSEDVQQKIVGLKPNKSIHGSYAYIEPLTGIPIKSCARSQSNIVIPPLTRFTSQVQKFSNITIPMFWIEYKQSGLPYYVKDLINFTVNILPKYQFYFVGLILILGLLCLVVSFRSILRRSRKNISNYKKNTNMHFEHETFLKR